MQIRPLFLLSLLFAISAPASATLVAGSEKGVTAPILDVAPFDQTHARMATDGNAFLAVWIDRTLSGDGDVHGALVMPEGKRASDDVLQIAVTDANEARVGIAFGAGRYLVVWTGAESLRGRFVSPDGAMSTPFDLAPLTLRDVEPHVVFNGNRFFVTWLGVGSFRGAIVDPSGTVLKAFDVAPLTQTSFFTTAVAANGTFSFISSITDFNGVPNGNGYPGDVGITPVDENGNVGARVVLAPATTPVFDLHASTRNNEFLIAWSTAIGIPGATVRTVLVTPSGAQPVQTFPAEGMYVQDVVADRFGFLVIYGSPTVKRAMHLSEVTAIVQVETPPTPSEVFDAASNGARTIALVRGYARAGFELGPAGADLYLTRLDTQEIEPLVVAPRHQASPDVAAAGDLRLAVWCEYIGSERRLGIIGARVAADGTPLDANGIDLHADVYHPAAPRVASNGTDWLVTWSAGTNLYSSRVARNGTLIDAAPMLIASQIFENSDVAVSWDGTQYVVAFFRGQFLRGLRTTVRALRVTAQGAVAAPELTLSAEGSNELPAIASGGGHSLLVWRSGIYLTGTLLSAGGTATPIGFATSVPMLPRPSVAWNDGTFLVAAPFRGGFGDEIQWMLVSNSGVVSTPLSPFLDVVVKSSGGYSSVEAEAFEDGFLLYWNAVGSEAVYVARIGGAGLLADPARSIGSTIVNFTPSFGASGNMVVTSHRIGHPTRELARVFTRTVQTVPGKPRRRAVR